LLKREYIAIVEPELFLTVMTGHYRLTRLRVSLLPSTRIRRDRNPSLGLMALDPAWDEGCKSCSFVADNFTEALEFRPAPKARNAAQPQERQRSAAVGGKRDDSVSRCESQAGWN
jgi:hypothetical protein